MEFQYDRNGSMVELEEFEEPQTEVREQPVEPEIEQLPIETPSEPIMRRSGRIYTELDRLFLLKGSQEQLELGSDPMTFKEAISNVDKGTMAKGHEM